MLMQEAWQRHFQEPNSDLPFWFQVYDDPGSCIGTLSKTTIEIEDGGRVVCCAGLLCTGRPCKIMH